MILQNAPPIPARNFNLNRHFSLCFRIHKLQCQHAAIARATTRWVKTASWFPFSLLPSLVSSRLSPCFRLFLERFVDGGRGTLRRRKILSRKRGPQSPGQWVRSIKIYACATPLQQACIRFSDGNQGNAALLRDARFLFLRCNCWKRTGCKPVLTLLQSVGLLVQGYPLLLLHFPLPVVCLLILGQWTVRFYVCRHNGRFSSMFLLVKFSSLWKFNHLLCEWYSRMLLVRILRLVNVSQ